MPGGITWRRGDAGLEKAVMPVKLGQSLEKIAEDLVEDVLVFPTNFQNEYTEKL